MAHSELELRIQWLDRGKYFIGGRYIDPDTDRESDLIEPQRIEIDPAALQSHAIDPAAYGAALTDMVFGKPESRIHQAFVQARTHAAQRDGLRIRLHVQASAPELYAVHWELMREPGKDTPLLSNTRLWFSRFLSSDDFLLRPLSDPDKVQMLAVVANPGDLATRWHQAPIDPAQELRRMQAAIDEEAWHAPRKIKLSTLQGRASLYNIVSSLRDSNCDVLYLACHGTITADGAPRLLLENDEGLGEVVRGEDLVTRIASAEQRPRLIILASCRSADGRGDQALAALAPRLLLAGVPNVVAMQGDVSIESAGRFMRRFFRELAEDGQIDRAVAIARADIQERPDWWMPTLYTQSKSGILWPPRGVAAGTFEHWDAVVSNVVNQMCVPVLGPGLVEPVIGSSREIARTWAERYEFPLAPNERDDLAQVAQHLAYQNGPSFVVDAIRSYVVGYLRRSYGEVLPPELMTAPVRQGLVDRMVSHIGKGLRDSDPYEVHALLAQLPLPIYINANRDNLLYDALIEQGRKPRILLCTWRSSGDQAIEYGPQLDASYTPSELEPLILHVFGNYQYHESLVITEDDYFEFLMGVTRNETRGMNGIPRAVSAAIASSGLLLLGFRVEDWDFRAVLGSVLRQPGRFLQRRRTSVAIQMTPSDEHPVPERMLKYLQRYFHDQSNINLFWSSPQEFLAQLVENCKHAQAA